MERVEWERRVLGLLNLMLATPITAVDQQALDLTWRMWMNEAHELVRQRPTTEPTAEDYREWFEALREELSRAEKQIAWLVRGEAR